jgi:predicted Zn-dependent peptidase
MTSPSLTWPDNGVETAANVASPARDARHPGPRSRRQPYQKTTLENGLRVVTEAMPCVRSLALGVLVNAGLGEEGPEQNGLAHLTEHMLFQGTSNRSAHQIAQMMDLAGGQIGGFTSRDYTCYHATVLDDYHPYALDLLGDLFLNPTFPLESLEREKHAILCEMEASRDSPSDRVNNCLKRAAWGDHPLGRPVTGTPRTVAALTREDVIYFFHKHYVPDQIVIAAAGHVEHLDFVAQVRDAFWRLLGERQPDAPPPPAHRAGVAVETAPVSQAYFSLGIPVHPYAHPERYALHVLNGLLGGGCSSRLFQRLREQRGLVYHIGSEYHAYRDAGLLVVEGSTAPESLVAVLGLTLVELWRLATGDDPVTEEELWKANLQVRRQHLLAAECSHTVMSRLATQELYFGRHLPSGLIVREIEAVDGPAVRRLCTELLVPALRSVTLAVVGPEAPGHCDTATLEDLLAQFV